LKGRLFSAAVTRANAGKKLQTLCICHTDTAFEGAFRGNLEDTPKSLALTKISRHGHRARSARVGVTNSHQNRRSPFVIPRLVLGIHGDGRSDTSQVF